MKIKRQFEKTMRKIDIEKGREERVRVEKNTFKCKSVDLDLKRSQAPLKSTL